MDVKKRNKKGTLNISENVIEKIAQLVIDEMDGVYSMAKSPSKWGDFLFSSRKHRSVRLKLEAGVAEIDIYIILKAGYRMKEVAENLQEFIKDSVQNMASITVSKVNVFVCGVASEQAS